MHPMAEFQKRYYFVLDCKCLEPFSAGDRKFVQSRNRRRMRKRNAFRSIIDFPFNANNTIFKTNILKSEEERNVR